MSSMKALLIIMILNSFIFANISNTAYEKFVSNLEKVSSNITPEQEAKLYMLALATQRDILLSMPVDKLSDTTISTILSLQKDNQITQLQSKELEKSYLFMIKDTTNKNTNATLYIFAVFVGMMIGLFVGYLKLGKKTQHKQLYEIRVEESDKDKKIIKDLQDLNNKLKKEINLLKLSI
jgi:hypothetical protein